MSVRVLAPGMLSTLQDAGRHGCRHLGIGSAGALDGYSHAIANLLVGNPVDAPALETTLTGPRLRFDHPARIALCGARVDARAATDDADDGTAIPGWRPIELPAGCTLDIGACRQGARCYLAIAGGFAAPQVLGSASTDLRGGFGGFRGRALAEGDILAVARTDTRPHIECVHIPSWWIDPSPDLDFATPAIIRILPGHDATAPVDALFARGWTVAASSNRQGLRLEGQALHLPADAPGAEERISEPVAPGTVQLPTDGQPIVLLADAQSHGGYPRIGHAIVGDRPRLAQLRPGDPVHFAPCTPAQARQLHLEQTQRLARINLAIAARR